MRLCIQREQERTHWKSEMGQYEVLAICNEIATAMAMSRAGHGTDEREEDAIWHEDIQKLCVEYDPEVQQFTWVRNGISEMDTEIMCLIVIGEIYKSWLQS